MFLQTPFDENKPNIIWKYLNGPKQALLSNDCGVFTTHVFAMYINFQKSRDHNIILKILLITIYQ